MAYKYARISPSALAATERCPRFRPDGEESQAAIDGTMFHDMMEEMVTRIPYDQWESWVATRPASPGLAGLLESATATLKTVVTEGMEVFPSFRLRLRGGKPRKTPLKPGLYPECELERGQGRHGYIDLMAVTDEGLVYIIDYKSNRVSKDFSWQLGAYAVDVNNLCTAHTGFVCMIIAPRLNDDDQLRMEIGPHELDVLRHRIDSIEITADRALWDDGVRSCPGDQCEHCHAKGFCRTQADAARLIAESSTRDLVQVTKTGRESVIQSLSSLVGRGGPYEGEVLTADTFTRPATAKQRGLRRACLKFLEVLVDRAKKSDVEWAKTVPPERLQTEIPGFSISWCAGRGSVDGDRMADIKRDIMSTFGLTLEDVFSVSDVNKDKLVELLVLQGHRKTATETEVKKLYEPYTTPGAPTLRWTQKTVSGRSALDVVPA